MTNQRVARAFRFVCPPDQQDMAAELLRTQGFAFEEEPFCPLCQRLLLEPFPLGSSLAAFFGYIYIQDRSSMLPPLALGAAPGDFVVDMCASPGSKTSFLCQLTGKNGLILANEPNPARFSTLHANLARLNLFNYGLSRFDATKIALPENSAGRILLDPPCSGWGTIAKHPAAARIWQGEKIRPLAALQRKLLNAANKILRPTGRLLYSTCTTNPVENERQVEFALENLGLELMPLKPFPGFSFNQALLEKGMLLVDGEASESQGFFMALLRKKQKEAPEPDYPKFAPPAALPLDIPLPGPGESALFGDKVRYIARQATEYFPAGFPWQGPALGDWKKASGFTPLKNLRYPELFARSPLPRVEFESVTSLLDLLAGRQIECSVKSGLASLWWRSLPLGFARVKNQRVINPFRNFARAN